MNRSYFSLANQHTISTIVNKRQGETKLGEVIQIPNENRLPLSEILNGSQAPFVLLGIPEDIGVRANFGIGGCQKTWVSFLNSFLNIQSTDKFKGNEILLLGHFDFTDWMIQSQNCSIEELRNLVAKIDEEVSPIIQKIIEAQKIPIVIGGGHNNAYPLIKGSSIGFKNAINVINLDAHSDYRTQEGRHSGNGFRYAKNEGYLCKYAMIGLHENYNSYNVIQDMLMQPSSIHFSYFENIFFNPSYSFNLAIEDAIVFTKENKVGIELDLDCIQNVLSSAMTPSGISTLQARQYLSTCAINSDVCYLHLTEAAVELQDGRATPLTAKLLSYLVSDFVKSYLSKAVRQNLPY